MEDLNKRLNKLFESFEGFPVKSPIVRNGQKNDAFVVLVFEVLFQNYHNIKKFEYDIESHREILIQYIVAPPDDSVDIFFEENLVDECKYHIVQVKNASLTQSEIETCFITMEHSIKQYLRKPKETRTNLKKVIVDTDFSAQYKNSITYYVVHKGETNCIRNQRLNQKIVTFRELSILERGTKKMSVPSETFEIDTANNFIINNFIEDKNRGLGNNNIPQSLLCNFSGYDLAKLNNKYSNTLIGSNILYGLNLRESLNKNSKTFEKMFETIEKEPDLFLFYNNGITILSSYFNAKNSLGKETITVDDFSIINGAQTTSTLGAYLREAELNCELEKIENLKKVFVLTKIYQINKELINHEKISENIKIYNNTQTPLSSRDMVSIRKEQIRLQERFLECPAPNIYINIKKGVEFPSFPKTYPHQRINNETLAQLALCGFLIEPFTAKDKKAKIFDNEGKEGITLNEIYHKLFDEKDGILNSKSNIEIDELLFVYKLHEEAKKYQKQFLKDQINNANQIASKNDFDKTSKEENINRLRRNMEISNVCLFYNIAVYFEIKRNFESYIKEQKHFDIKRFYGDKVFKDELVKEFLKLCFKLTVETVRKNSGGDNVTNWIRSEKNEKIFLSAIRAHLIDNGYEIKEQYLTFVENFKVLNTILF